VLERVVISILHRWIAREAIESAYSIEGGCEFGKMLNYFMGPHNIIKPVYTTKSLRLLAASVVILLLVLSACSKKSKAPIAPSSPLRVVFLPFNVPENSKDLQWVAMASPILMSKVCEFAPDLVAVPFWDSMPVAIESAGASRIFTDESAQSAAGWLSAKWAIMGDISPGRRKSISLIIDFIPSRGNEVPFRYMKTAKMEYLGSGYPVAFTQFLRYLTIRPLQHSKSEDLSMASLKPLAEAVNREYGWFADAEPGKAQEIVADLALKDSRLARLLFNPSVYPVLKKNDE
jgi:hypothetical protein